MHQRESDLIEQLGDSWWHETTRLYAAQADASAVISACLAGGHPSVPRLTLAIECLEEAQEVQPRIRAEVDGILKQGVEDPDPGRRVATSQALLALRLRRMLRIDEDVYIDASCVSCGEYQLFLDERKQRGEFHQPDHWGQSRFPAGCGIDEVTGMRPSDAVAFCQWLTERDPEGWSYQLISESQIPVDETQVPRMTGYWYSSANGVQCLSVANPRVDLTFNRALGRPERTVPGLHLFGSRDDDEIDRIVNQASLIVQDNTSELSEPQLREFADALDQAVVSACAAAIGSTRKLEDGFGVVMKRALEFAKDRPLNIDQALALANEMSQDVERALFRSRAADHAHTRALDFACLLFKVATFRSEQPLSASLLLPSLLQAFFVLASLFSHAGAADTPGLEKKREHMIRACIHLFVDTAILEHRSTLSLDSFEAIRIAKIRKGRSRSL